MRSPDERKDWRPDVKSPQGPFFRETARSATPVIRGDLATSTGKKVTNPSTMTNRGLARATQRRVVGVRPA